MRPMEEGFFNLTLIASILILTEWEVNRKSSILQSFSGKHMCTTVRLVTRLLSRRCMGKSWNLPFWPRYPLRHSTTAMSSVSSPTSFIPSLYLSYPGPLSGALLIEFSYDFPLLRPNALFIQGSTWPSVDAFPSELLDTSVISHFIEPADLMESVFRSG